MINKLSNSEILIIVNRYIGVEGGFLGDFSYRTHAEFYPLFCELEINPNEFEGTTRERFIEILSSQSPKHQSQIIRGVLDRFQVDAKNKPESRTTKLHNELFRIASRLSSGQCVSAVSLETSYDVVFQALQDAETLMKSTGASSAIDRLFTALQGYMKYILDDEDIDFPSDPSITLLYKNLKENHPAFQLTGHRPQDMRKIFRNVSSIIDTLQPIRNKASLAHPNKLLDDPEAMLVINSTRTILQFLDNKIQAWKNQQTDDIPF